MGLAPTTLLAGTLLAILSLLVVRQRMLTPWGGLAAWGLGMIITLRAGVIWLLALGLFLVIGSVATRLGYLRKRERGTAEAKGGARRARNVLANGLVPAVIAAIAPTLDQVRPGWASVAYAGAIAAASSDTLASEFGSMSDKARLITNGRRVPPGTDGGVSLPGQVAALAGALILGGFTLFLVGTLGPSIAIGPVGVPTTMALVATVTLAGFLGCQVDSLLGALWERRGRLTKEEVNAGGILSGALVAVAIAASLQLIPVA